MSIVVCVCVRASLLTHRVPSSRIYTSQEKLEISSQQRVHLFCVDFVAYISKTLRITHMTSMHAVEDA